MRRVRGVRGARGVRGTRGVRGARGGGVVACTNTKAALAKGFVFESDLLAVAREPRFLSIRPDLLRTRY